MAMDKNELLKRIEKKEKDIEKINKRITKWSNGLRPQDIAICEPYGNCIYGTKPSTMNWYDYHGTKEYQEASNNYRQYLKDNEGMIPTSDDYNKGPNIGELHNAYIDLGEARNTLRNYQIQIDKIDNFEKEEKIEAIWSFLTEWEDKAFNWYKNNAQHYFELKRDFDQVWEAKKEEYIEKYSHLATKWRSAESYAKDHFIDDYYDAIDTLTKSLTNIHGHYEKYYGSKYIYTDYSFDDEKLKKILSDEKQRKYKDLVQRVTAITGVITDAKGLSVGNQRGELNGIIIGEKGKAYVETIGAGGHNIQCFHYRVLVNPIK